MPLIAAALQAAASAFVAQHCPDVQIAQIAAVARCGTVRVPEDRGRRRGRTIDLDVVILPATGPRTMPPLYDIDGGPGLNASKNAGFYATDGAAYRQSRDVVMIGQRGTGLPRRNAAAAVRDRELIGRTDRFAFVLNQAGAEGFVRRCAGAIRRQRRAT